MDEMSAHIIDCRKQMNSIKSRELMKPEKCLFSKFSTFEMDNRFCEIPTDTIMKRCGIKMLNKAV